MQRLTKVILSPESSPMIHLNRSCRTELRNDEVSNLRGASSKLETTEADSSTTADLPPSFHFGRAGIIFLLFLSNNCHYEHQSQSPYTG
jgi:hypothetical protein